MKTRSKVLSLVLAGTLVVSAGMFGTLAYLTDTAEVKNEFTVGKVEITLDEAKVDVDGEIVPEADRVISNNYKLMPGKTYIKDPVVHVADDSENSYLFVKVENGIAAIEGETTVDQQMKDNGWAEVSGIEGIYVYVGEGSTPAVVTADADVPVFENFTIDGKIGKETLNKYDQKTITVTAYAIQADGIEEDTANDIWAAAEFDSNSGATE